MSGPGCELFLWTERVEDLSLSQTEIVVGAYSLHGFVASSNFILWALWPGEHLLPVLREDFAQRLPNTKWDADISPKMQSSRKS